MIVERNNNKTKIFINFYYNNIMKYKKILIHFKYKNT